MKITKEQNGITLLALIITIIVLLILAGVALNTLFGSDGIISNSKYAQEEYIKSAEKDAITKAFAELKIKLYTDDSITAITAELVEQQLNEGGNNVEVEDGENGNFVITFKNTGNQYTVNSNGAILGEEKTEVANVPLEITGDIECTGGETTILVKVPTNVDTRATYIYHYKEEGGTEQTATSNSSTYTIEGLTVNKNYEVWVEAYNDYNEEHVISNHVTVRTEYGPYITVPEDFNYNGGTITGFNPDAASGVATMAKSGDRKVILAIPSEYDNDSTLTTVTTLGGNAFARCTNIVKVKLPNSITSAVGTYNGNANESTDRYNYSPFKYCEGLKEIEFTGEWTTIPNWLFGYCTGIEEVTIPNTVTTIGSYAFFRCRGLESITIPSNVTNVESNAFSGCTGLSSVTLSNGLTNIKENTFYGCTNLEEIEIPNSVTTLGANSFARCTKLEKVILPNSITSVVGTYNGNANESSDGYNYAPFKYCEGLKEIEFKGTWTTIPNWLFGYCTGIEEVTIPNTVTTIGSYAFFRCRGLESIEIPSTIISIDNYAFSGCTSLNNVIVPSSMTGISTGIFSGCTSLTNITIPNSITNIGADAFNGCSSLTNITLPNNLTTLNYCAFTGTGIETITIPKTLTSATVPGVPPLSNDYMKGPFYNSSIKTVMFSDGATTIPSNILSRCSTVQTVYVPESITTIGGSAFNGCTNLTTATYPGTRAQWINVTKGGGNDSLCSIIQCSDDAQVNLRSNNTDISYIASTGTQYILTDIIPTDTMGAYIKTSSSSTSSDLIYFGSKKSGDSRFWVGNYQNKVYLSWNATISADIRPQTAQDQVNEIELNFNNSRKMKYNGTDVYTITNTLSSSTNPIAIFAANDNGTINYKSSIKLYEFKISEGTNITHDFIPVYNTIVGQAGLYDTVEGKFYYSLGTNAFVAPE